MKSLELLQYKIKIQQLTPINLFKDKWETETTTFSIIKNNKIFQFILI